MLTNLNGEIKRKNIDKLHFSEAEYPFTVTPIFLNRKQYHTNFQTRTIS